MRNLLKIDRSYVWRTNKRRGTSSPSRPELEIYLNGQTQPPGLGGRIGVPGFWRAHWNSCERSSSSRGCIVACSRQLDSSGVGGGGPVVLRCHAPCPAT